MGIWNRESSLRIGVHLADCRYVYLTQLMQSEAVGSAYQTWRRNWKGPRKEYSAGAIVWQLNDTWPVSSWAIIDYFVSLYRGIGLISVPAQTSILFHRPIYETHYSRYPTRDRQKQAQRPT